MAHLVFDEHTKIVWATAVASVAAPTAAEANAGADLSTYLVSDGLKRGNKRSRVDDSSIASRHDHEFFGSYGEAPTLTFLKDDGTGSDLAYTTFKGAGFGNGFLLVRIGPLYTVANTAAQEWEVYPAQAAPIKKNDTARNARVTFEVEIAVTGTPNYFAVMA